MSISIKDLEIGKSAKITEVGGEGALRQHFLDMGLIPGLKSQWLNTRLWVTLLNSKFTDTS